MSCLRGSDSYHEIKEDATSPLDCNTSNMPNVCSCETRPVTSQDKSDENRLLEPPDEPTLSCCSLASSLTTACAASQTSPDDFPIAHPLCFDLEATSGYESCGGEFTVTAVSLNNKRIEVDEAWSARPPSDLVSYCRKCDTQAVFQCANCSVQRIENADAIEVVNHYNNNNHLNSTTAMDSNNRQRCECKQCSPLARNKHKTRLGRLLKALAAFVLGSSKRHKCTDRNQGFRMKYSKLSQNGESSGICQMEEDIGAKMTYDSIQGIWEWDDEDLTCNVCDRAFNNPSLLNRHMIKYRHWGCSVCESLFNTVMELEHHKAELEHWSDIEGLLLNEWTYRCDQGTRNNKAELAEMDDDDDEDSDDDDDTWFEDEVGQIQTHRLERQVETMFGPTVECESELLLSSSQ